MDIRVAAASFQIPLEHQGNAPSKPSNILLQSTLSSSYGASYASCFSWVWSKVSGFFSWVFCCESKEVPTSSDEFFKIESQSEVLYRLIINGEGTENQIRFSHNCATLQEIEIPDAERKEDVGRMLVAMMKKEKIDEVVTSNMGQAKLLHELGLVSQGSILLDFASQEDPHPFIAAIITSAYELREIVGEEVMARLDKKIASEIIGNAFLDEANERRRARYIEDELKKVEAQLPRFDPKRAFALAGRSLELSDAQKQQLENFNVNLGMSMSFVHLSHNQSLKISVRWTDLFDLAKIIGITMSRGTKLPSPMRFKLPG